MKLCTRGLSTNLKAPIFGKNSKSASTVKWVVPQFQIEFPVALSTISVRCARSSVHVSSPVIQSDVDSSTLHIPEENLEKNVEKGCSCVVESFQAYFATRTKVIVYLVEALDIYLLGTVMLVFGMGLYELFISNLDKGKSMSTPHRSNLFGMFTLKERPRWLEITTVSGLKTKIGHVIVMLLPIGLFDKSKRAVLNSPFDLLCFSASLLWLPLSAFKTHP